MLLLLCRRLSIFCGILVALLALAGVAHAQRNAFDYQVQFPPPPTNATDALNTLPARAAAVTAFMACGAEIDFFQALFASHPGEEPRKPPGEGTLDEVIGKIVWWQANARVGNLPPPCHGTYIVNSGQIGDAILWADLLDNAGAGIRTAMRRIYDQDACAPGPVVGVRPADDHRTVTIETSVSGPCMRAQINAALHGLSVSGQLGSSGLPCHLWSGGTTNGEWDVMVRDLVRIWFLNQHSPVPAALDDDVAAHVRDDLINVDGAPGLSSYSPLQCGDTESDTGTPQQRADSEDWLNETAATVTDDGAWFLERLALFLALVATGGLAGVLVGLTPGAAAAAGAIVVAATAAGSVARIPETENHQLMIESARYLKNQIIIDVLDSSGDDASGFRSDQVQEKAFLLGRFRSFLSQDFSEYNARPYGRYAMLAILNLADFAEDPDMVRGARMMLDYLGAKFAVGSSQGRRLVPYRRRMENVEEQIENPAGGIFDLAGGADHSVGYMLFYSGQTQQLPGNMVSRSAMGEMVAHASSAFAPDLLVLDLAMDKSAPYEQHIHHAGHEVYSNGPGWLVTGGGIETDSANKLMLGPVAVIGDPNDRGAAVPTTLMLAAGPDHTTLADLLRIEGPKHVWDAGNKEETFDANLCVWHGFACGLNLKVPADMESCLVRGPAGAGNEWRFLDTATCPPYASGPRVFVTIWRAPCQSDLEGCTDNFGFFEAVGVPAPASLTAFRTQVTQANPRGFATSVFSGAGDIFASVGRYHSANGSTITFSTDAYQFHPEQSGILAVDGVDQPSLTNLPLASGDVISADGHGVVGITNHKLGKTLVLDLSDAAHPTRTIK